MTSPLCTTRQPQERIRSASFSNDNKDLEKYVKYLFYKSSQIIVQSRQGGKSFTQSQASPTSQSWFCLAINDNSEITNEAKRAAGLRGVLRSTLCVEISLKTIEGDSMVLETWVLNWKEGSDPSVRVNNTVYNHMGLLLKSLLCVTRSIPAYRLSRRQGPETFVICYRVYSGEPCTSLLGDGFQTAQVGQVTTSIGTVQMRVDYRTQMTITPSCSSSGNDNFYATSATGSSGTGMPAAGLISTTSSCTSKTQQSFQVKSDHFFSDLVPHQESSQPMPTGHQKRFPRGGFTSESEQQTSDESQDAMKLFAASPPDPTSPYFRRQPHLASKPGHMSSNESLSSNKFYRPRSNTSQSSGSNAPAEQDEQQDIPRVGPFASRPVSSVERRFDEDDPLLQLFSVDNDTELDKKMEAMKVQPETTAPTAKEEAKPITKREEFVMLDLKTPFSAKKPDGANSELGIFFKTGDGSSANEGEVLSTQLCNLNQQLTSFEDNLEEFDDLLKTMETATSESESEVN